MPKFVQLCEQSIAFRVFTLLFASGFWLYFVR